MRMEQWANFLDVVTFAANNRIRDATGHSAYELMFGRNARLPIEAEAEMERSNNFMDRTRPPLICPGRSKPLRPYNK